MMLRRRTLLRLAVFLAFSLTILGNFYIDFSWVIESFPLSFKRGRLPSRGLNEYLFLEETQCRAAFPGLTNEISRAVARGSFTLERQPDDITGLIQARIENSKLYVLTADREPSQEMLLRRTAVLNQLHRAVVTSPTSLPDAFLAISIIDNPQENVWSFSRSNDPQVNGNYWIMPHFSFWSWPKPFIGSISEALSKIESIEAATTWDGKTSKAVWRGTAWYNSAGNTNMRPNLLLVTKGRDWADVEDLEWGNGGADAKNAIKIWDFCKYKYIIYTEGVTYSGRLPFHQACESVILTPPLNYLMHTTHLMRPLFSSTLPFHTLFESSHKPDSRWPSSYPASKANVVFVSPDWSDLEHTIAWLEENPDIAHGIATRQRRMNVDGGYLSSAAEVCYWRSLIGGWSEVVKLGKTWDNSSEGMRWETFSLTSKAKWDYQ